MTELPEDASQNEAQQALRALVHDAKDTAALHTLAHSDILVPVPPDASEADEAGTLDLPVMRRSDGADLVPVFTSEPRMVHALPTVRRYRLLPLANAWPSDEVCLTIDVHTADTVTLNATGVRTLLGRSGG